MSASDLQAFNGINDVLRLGRRRGRRAVCIAAGCVTLAVVPHAWGINIQATYQGGSPPTADPFGNRLMSIVNAAIEIWEDALPDPSSNYEVEIFWDDISGLGRYNDSGPDAPNIVFDNDRNWYFDETPFDHSEYNMDWIRQDGVTEGISGSPPSNLEIGYRGPKTGAHPKPGDHYDLLSTALHELGHALGLNFPEVSGWDLNILYTGLRPIHVDVDEDLFDGGSHVAPTTMLMAKGQGALNIRRLPSSTDILVIAADESLADIDLPRRQFIPTSGASLSDLNFPFNWVGQTPGVGNSAVFHDGEAEASDDLWVKDLTLSFATNIYTRNHDIRASDTTIIEEASQFYIEPHGSLSSGVLISRDSGQIYLDSDDTGNASVFVFESLTIDPSSRIRGDGGIFLVGAPLVNDGLIEAVGGNLIIDATNSPASVFDLDGTTENGRLRAHGGSLVIGDIIGSGHFADAFSGVITIKNSSSVGSVKFRLDWDLDASGVLQFEGSSTFVTAAAVLEGETATIDGTVSVDGLGEIKAPTHFTPLARIEVPDSDDTLILSNTATFAGTSITGSGTLRQLADLSIVGDTTVDVDTFDWGNSFVTDTNTLSVDPGVKLIVDSTSTGTLENVYRGVVQLDGGQLQVNKIGWALPAGFLGVSGGTLNMEQVGGHAPVVSGKPLTVGGTINVSGGLGVIESTLIVADTAQINIDSGATLRLDGLAVFQGGQVDGDGTLVQNGDMIVNADTTINAGTYDWGNSFVALDGTPHIHSTTIDPFVTLTIDSNLDGLYRGVIQVNSGVLQFNALGLFLPKQQDIPMLPPSVYEPAGVLNLHHVSSHTLPPVVRGQPITLGGQIHVSGGIGVIESDLITLDSALIHIDSGSSLRLDGVVTLSHGAEVVYGDDGELSFANHLALGTARFNHGSSDAGLLSDAGAVLQWGPGSAIHVDGQAEGSLTWQLAPGTTVQVPDGRIPPTLTISPNATLNVAGRVDPFTDSVDPTKHVNVINDSVASFNVLSGAHIAVGSITGVGATRVEPSATLSVHTIEQSTLVVEPEATLNVTGFENSITVGTADISGTLDLLVPEEVFDGRLLGAMYTIFTYDARTSEGVFSAVTGMRDGTDFALAPWFTDTDGGHDRRRADPAGDGPR